MFHIGKHLLLLRLWREVLLAHHGGGHQGGGGGSDRGGGRFGSGREGGRRPDRGGGPEGRGDGGRPGHHDGDGFRPEGDGDREREGRHRPDGGGFRPDRDRPHRPDHEDDRPAPHRPEQEDEGALQGPFRVRRPEDMLVVDISLVNLRHDGRQLVRQAPGPAQILVTLPPQHVAEGVLPALPLTADPVVPAFSARPSTLAFSLPDDMEGVGLTLASLLDWTQLILQPVPVVGSPDPGDGFVFGGVRKTAVEFPMRLLLTYDDSLTNHWEHLTDPFVSDGRSELWHTSLLGAEGSGEALLRAVATAADRGELPAGLPLLQEHLNGIVVQTSRHEVFDKNGLPIEILSEPLHAEQFRLTPLGASAHLHGSWELPDRSLQQFTEAGQTPPLASYDHITGLGRDQYLRTASRYFCHTGHKALWVVETRRVFTAAPDGTVVAGLATEQHAEFPQPDISYGPGTGYVHQGREMPLRSLHINERVSPLLKPGAATGPFWAALAGADADYLLPVTGTDQEGRQVSFRMPLLLVPGKNAADGSVEGMFPHVADKPVAFASDDPHALAALDGQEMAIAEPLPAVPAGTCHPVTTLRFDVKHIVSGGDHPLDAVLFVAGAEVREPAVEAFAPGGGRVQVRMNAGYLDRGFTDNPSGAYLTMNTPVQLLLKAEQAGGLASPNASVSEITGRAGVLPEAFAKSPVAGAAAAVPKADIEKAFGIGKLLGIVSLTDILGDIQESAVTELAQLSESKIEQILKDNDPRSLLPVPLLRVTELLDGAGKELRYVWKPPLKSSGMLDLAGASLVLDARTTRSPDGLEKSSVSGALTGLTLKFAGLAQVKISRLAFTSRPGSSPEVDASGLELVFEGALSFINNLRSLLPADGFGKGAYIDIDPAGISAGYTLAVPSIGVGVFSLQNLSLSAGLTIPFEASPIRFRFAICERQNPFNVSVSLFGGGGFFAMEVSSRGIEVIEGALEFGGTAALNLGIATGGVSIMAGVYFKLDNSVPGSQNITLSGYLRCNGYLSVLGIVTVSVEFYLELSYQKSGGESVIRGRGTLSVSVRIAFFSKTVSLTLERSFAGAPGDPTFAQCVEPEDWDTYCLAFAA
ncbi:hypothetical protein ACFWFI_04165 [Streptomyces sp. NPDC060209]|uniref:hypothetical protein n=1 Tax=Streptomyces sp. NPDC060209 TaxID=3347073 RepID=UPI0036642FBC